MRHAIILVGLVVLIVFAPAAIGSLPTVLVLGISPAVVALALVGVSVHSVLRHFSFVQTALGTATTLLCVVSLWTLARMFFLRAWPSYLPYLGIALAVPITAIQLYMRRTLAP